MGTTFGMRMPDDAEASRPLVARPPTAQQTDAQRARTRRNFMLLSVLLMLVGPVMIVVGSIMVGAQADLLATGTTTTGVVTEVQDGVEASDHRFSLEYVAGDGSDHRLWVAWPLDGEPTRGDRIDVVYRASDPGSAMAVGYEGVGESVRGLGAVFTVVFTLLGVIMLRASGAERRRARALKRAQAETPGNR